MTDRVFEPSRLVLARRRSGKSRSELATECELKSRSIVAYEQGERAPNDDTVATIAKALSFPDSFFYRPAVERIGADGVSFRSLARTAAGRREQALAAGEMALMLIDHVESKFDLRVPRVPDMHPQPSAEVAARSLRTLWGLADKPIPNVVKELEANGVRVFSLAENTKEIDAFSFWRDAKPFVFLNTMKSAERSRFDAAHELGHLVLHQHGQASGRAAEVEANAFASAFLMPETSVRRYGPRRPALQDLVETKSFWGVSVSALAYRLHRLSMITDWQYHSLCIQIQSHGYRDSEPRPMARELSEIWPLVFAGLKEDGVSRADLARQLCWPLDELRGLVFQLVLTGETGGSSKAEDVPPPRIRRVK